jgi:aspartate racemase
VKRGAEGVVLGCTEMPFLIRPEDTPLPLFNTTELHAQKALDYAERNEADRIAS